MAYEVPSVVNKSSQYSTVLVVLDKEGKGEEKEEGKRDVYVPFSLQVYTVSHSCVYSVYRGESVYRV